MKGIYFNGERPLYREDLAIPVPRKGESLVRILMAAVCNTDKEIVKGYRPDFSGVMGHEFVGVVESSPCQKEEPIAVLGDGRLAYNHAGISGAGIPCDGNR